MSWRDDNQRPRTCILCGQTYFGDLGHRNCPKRAVEKQKQPNGDTSQNHTPHCGMCGGEIEDPHNDGHPDNLEIFNLLSRGVIEITVVPSGEAPLEIRQGWIGVRIPTVCYVNKDGSSRGVISKRGVGVAPRYMVLQTVAIEALAKQDQDAARWWREAGFPKHDTCFAFRAEEVREVEPVSPRM